MRNLLFLISIIMLSACAVLKKDVDNTELIAMRKTPCRGECMVYSLTISNGGLLKYEGKAHVNTIGKREKQLSSNELKALQKEFMEANNSDFNNEYTAEITDLPSVYLTYTNAGESKTVRDHYKGPETLKELELSVEKLVEEWLK
ncbi:MAG: DUF6438 domain-containing protein [Bacteroidales bacterium]|jgi:hypothetical protein|nr:DUF6438 domain-containing protein [Bacteroidales bacterium]